MEKKILYALILICIYYVVWDLLRILDIVAMTDRHAAAYNILFSLLTVFILGGLVRHRLWMLAWVFIGLFKVARILAAVLFKTFRSIDNVPSISVTIAGMLFAFMAMVCFYRLLRAEDFSFRKYARFKKKSLR